VDDEDIVQHFARSNAFIREGLATGGGVLVHWYVLEICFAKLPIWEILS
jgi:hypothetical protein